ncbi:ABC transporter substrate-binding protein [Alkalihalobacillus sp. LMS6]|uniref:ABC transporter substrate-binding protein n=1 Tax=Bacillaceae TaxID=186817 RepID=UPI000C08A747|nr:MULTISPECIES: ABC transporter substrate-binding protein [Bacillaceae]UTR06895.1 ABC transporter substrate-binding protein [Alkalihalobacillus sp. LMS6]
MKRTYKFLFSIAALGLLATGCNADEDTGGGNESSGGSDQGEIEIFSWWTGAGEEDGLLALIDYFEEEYSELTVVNAAVAGGAGTNAKAVLATRMQGNDPPSTFQVHAGEELIQTWVAAGMMEPLNEFYDEHDLLDKFPEELIEMVSDEGDIYSVPMNIHRSNVVFYNRSVFEEHNLEIPTSLEELMDVAETLQDADITPIALGDQEPWTATHLFENVLLAELGPESYNRLWQGELSFEDESVVQAANQFAGLLDYVNPDHASRNWQDSAQLVGEGEAAMINMGDWAHGYLLNDLGLEVNEDYGYFPFPGTEGSFNVVSDTFGLPTGVENPDEVKEFLSVLATPEAQDIFNPLKGGIPARIDADESQYDVYGQSAIDDFRNGVLTPSLAHGSAMSEGYLTQANQAVNIFVTQKDVDRFVESLESARDE